MTLIERLLIALASLATILTALALAPVHPFGDTSSVEATAAISQQPNQISGTATVEMPSSR